MLIFDLGLRRVKNGNLTYSYFVMKETGVKSLAAFELVKSENRAVLFYFSTLSCSVGEALEPKVKRMIRRDFSKIEFVWIDMNAVPDVAASNSVFVEPTILLFIDGKEYLRKSRNINLSEVHESLERLYILAFE